VRGVLSLSYDETASKGSEKEAPQAFGGFFCVDPMTGPAARPWRGDRASVPRLQFDRSSTNAML
jgi:hypothetical protein